MAGEGVGVNLEEVEGLDLSVLGRARWERDQAVRVLQLLWWIGRFWFGEWRGGERAVRDLVAAGELQNPAA